MSDHFEPAVGEYKTYTTVPTRLNQKAEYLGCILRFVELHDPSGVAITSGKIAYSVLSNAGKATPDVSLSNKTAPKGMFLGTGTHGQHGFILTRGEPRALGKTILTDGSAAAGKMLVGKADSVFTSMAPSQAALSAVGIAGVALGTDASNVLTLGEIRCE